MLVRKSLNAAGKGASVNNKQSEKKFNDIIICKMIYYSIITLANLEKEIPSAPMRSRT